MPQPTQPASSRPVATPKDTELAVVMSVPSHLIHEGTVPELETPYNKMPGWADQTLNGMGYGDYILTMVKNGSEEMINFFFGKDKTKEEAAKPFHKYWKKHGNHRWPPILKSIEILADYSFPRSTNTIVDGVVGVAVGPTYFDRYVFIPDVNEGTRFLFEEFTSPRPFKIGVYRTPVPTGIQYSIPGLSGSFGECLHDDVLFPDLRTVTQVIATGGTASLSNGNLAGQFFPKTNFKTWLPYVVYCEQEQDKGSGVWYMQRIRVFPPFRPRAIRR
jgi:hypothetical protein